MSQDLREKLQGNSERSQPTETKDDREARNDFWSLEGDYRHHVAPRVQILVPKEESFPIPLEYIDVTRTTRTILNVLQETRIDDHWNVDVDRNLSDLWTRFTKFTLLNEKPPKGIYLLRGAAYKDSKKPFKNARKKFEIPKEEGCPCKTGTKKRPDKLRETASATNESNNIQKTKPQATRASSKNKIWLHRGCS